MRCGHSRPWSIDQGRIALRPVASARVEYAAGRPPCIESTSFPVAQGFVARILFVILLALNLGALAWQLTRPTAEPAAGTAAVDAGVAPLVLLAERDRSAMQHSAALAEAAPVEAARPRVCESLGPFGDRDGAQDALRQLESLTRRTQVRQTRARVVRGYWVHVPAHASRSDALATARQLAAAGVRDYYVVTAGGQENTISLGLFRDQANAESRRAQVAALGFRARVVERADERDQYWIDYESRDDKAPEWRKLISGASELKSSKVACF